jgi:hypothetical protein
LKLVFACNPPLCHYPSGMGPVARSPAALTRPFRRAGTTTAAVNDPKYLILQPLPRWSRAGTLSADARAGVALFALDQIIRADPPWLGALRMRLALEAAVASARLLRLSADEAALRDAEQLTRSGDDPGPAGRVHRIWRSFAARPARLAGETAEARAAEIGAGAGAEEVIALLQADSDLATALGWHRPLPLVATVIADPLWREGRERRAFRVGGEGWVARRMAVLGLAAARAHGLAVELARRADVVTLAAGTLRTRDGGGGLTLILGDDCVAPWRMTAPGRGKGDARQGLGSDRAARRFCESLHAMGALRLLTDRPTFRFYGL